MRLGISLSLTQQFGGFSPASLFALAEPGVWYDPSDLTTLFQDAAGTTPVTAAGQPVGLVLDKSKGLVLGPELVTTWASTSLNTFSGSGTGFSGTKTQTVSISGSSIGPFSVVAGVFYLLNLVVNSASTSAENWRFCLTTSTNGLSNSSTRLTAQAAVTNSATTQTISVFLVPTASSEAAYLELQLPATRTGSISVATTSIKGIPGNHATQATAASRPTYGVVPATGRRNLLTYTEQFDNAAWVKTAMAVTANAGIAPNGTTTADLVTQSLAPLYSFTIQSETTRTGTLSCYAKQDVARYFILGRGTYASGDLAVFDLQAGTITQSPTFSGTTAEIVSVGSGWYRCILKSAQSTNSNGFSISGAATGLANQATGGIFIWGAQLETGSTATAYQRVGSAFDVTEAGVPSLSYLSFDGVDDFLATPTITPSTDKAQVFAGVRKLSDAAVAVLIESSSSVNSNNGTFAVFAPQNAGVANYGFNSKGTIAAVATATGFAAPISNVITALGDISGDTSTLRANGTQVAQNTTDQGTGNYLAYPLYIGRRAGTFLPFNGQIYSLIVRFGANLTAQQISNTETWVNGKTGAY